MTTAQPTIEILLDTMHRRDKGLIISNSDLALVPQDIVFKRFTVPEYHMLHSARLVKKCPAEAKVTPSQLELLIDVNPSLYLKMTADDLHYLWKVMKSQEASLELESIFELLKMPALRYAYISIDIFTDDVLV